MLGVRLDPELEKRLDRLAAKTGRTKSYYAREAILEYVEDREDYEIAVAEARMATPHISLEELIRKYGLADQLQQEGRKAVRQARTGNQVASGRLSSRARRRTA